MTKKEYRNLKIGDKVKNTCASFCFCSKQGQTGTIISKNDDKSNFEIRWDNKHNGSESHKIMYALYHLHPLNTIVNNNEFNLLNGGALI